MFDEFEDELTHLRRLLQMARECGFEDLEAAIRAQLDEVARQLIGYANQLKELHR